eukprot:1567722-Rhodomonas_salina.1
MVDDMPLDASASRCSSTTAQYSMRKHRYLREEPKGCYDDMHFVVVRKRNVPVETEEAKRDPSSEHGKGPEELTEEILLCDLVPADIQNLASAQCLRQCRT